MADDDPVEPDNTEALVVARARSLDGRRWLEVLTKFVEAYSREPDRHALAQTALDDALIAVCRRVSRIARDDLGPESPGQDP